MGERLALVELVALSDVGRVRHHNEDRALGRLPVIAVADGMGGAKAGEVAAQMAVDAVAALAEPVASEDVRQAIEQANRSIHELAQVDSEKTGMGTTLTAALLSGSALSVLHVGDSRAYLWRAGELTQITDDHSVVAELVRRGSLTADEAEIHPHRNVITRALGAESRVQPDIVNLPLLDGDVVLLCSDGLTGFVRDGDIARTLADGGDLHAAATTLIERANRAGGADNITVVLARVAAAEEGTGDTATMATVEEPLPPPRPGDTATLRVGGAARQEARAAVPPPRVLEPVTRRRRRRLVPLAIVVVAALVIGGLTWIGSRTYVLAEAPDGTVNVMHGLPINLLGWEPAGQWQSTSVPAEAVRAGRPDALSGSWRGQGEAVALAVDLVWRFGLPEPPELAAPSGGGVIGGGESDTDTARPGGTPTSTTPERTTTTTAPAPTTTAPTP